MISAAEQFRAFLAKHHHLYEGPLIIDSPIKFERARCPIAFSKNQSLSYFIRVDNDGRHYGYFKCFAGVCAGLEQSWIEENESKNFKKLTKNQLKQKMVEMYEQKKLDLGDRLAQEERCAASARNGFEQASTQNLELVPYVENKKFIPYGLKKWGDTLMVPLRDVSGKLWNIERIYSNHQKRPINGARVNGLFHLIGEIDPSGILYLCEGVASACIVFEALGLPTICCRNADNLFKVAQDIKKVYPEIKIKIASDDDFFKLEQTKKMLLADGKKIPQSLKNAGLSVALKIKKILGAEIASPDFTTLGAAEMLLKREKPPSDFHDIFYELLQRRGNRTAALDIVRQQLLNVNKEYIMAQNRIEGHQHSSKNQKDNEKKITPLNAKIAKDDYPDLKLTKDGNKQPLNTHGNLKYMLGRLGIDVKWNSMSRAREVQMPSFKLFRDDVENSALNEITNLAALNHMPTTKIDDHLNSIAWANSYHPIVQCILSKPWDGEPRLDTFIRTIKADKPDLAYKLIRKWMLSAVSAIFVKDGFASQGVLVLQAPQNSLKTRWVKSLDPIKCNAVKEGAVLDPKDKDSVITCTSHWITELGELDATFRKADIARLKSFITCEVDIIRFPFARKNSRLPRRTVFVATVNTDRFLVDETGNRRWWAIAVKSIDLNHGLDMQQIWAEAYVEYLKDSQTWLTSDELDQLTVSNIEHKQIDPLEEKVIEYFDWSDGWQNYNTTNMTASEVLFELGYKQPTISETTRMGSILKNLTGKKPERRKHMLPRRNPNLFAK